MSIKFIVAIISTSAQHAEDVERALERAVPEVRKESGCLQYDLHRDQTRPGRFVMIERWRDAEALKAHGEATAFKALSEVLSTRATLDIADLAAVV
ncbi:putative quinol monooxygenase [Burkholderia gladioli]|uniref:putative quinol monooxygenase n=1 Tax=Burkholderia gladioli TaxID=28095 RepID=UPI0016410ACB|nr:putative quinol monooxygenase [Burkholderia gladioli]